MTIWKLGVAVGPLLVMGIAVILRAQRAITRAQMATAIVVSAAIATLFLTM